MEIFGIEMDRWVILFYISFGFFLTQLLRSYYVKHDPQYSDPEYNRRWHNYIMEEGEKGRFEVGLSFFHSRKDTVGYKFGYRSAILLGITTFFILLPILFHLPNHEINGLETFSRDYMLWIAFPLVSIWLIADFFGPSLTKFILNGTLIAMTFLIFYLSLSNNGKTWVITPFLAIFWGLIGIGYKWLTSWVRDRLQKYGVIMVLLLFIECQ